MEHQIFFFCLLSLAVLSTEVAEAYPGNALDQERERGKVKLFVFGDSYVDTGNMPRSLSKSWKPPYGITFPGEPSGRFSNGHVLSDFVASFLGIKSPMPYKLIKNFDMNTTQYGINFAHGGTGVFETLVDYPNMTSQIDFFQQLINKNVYTTQDLNSSIALISLLGNDYFAYLANNGTLQDVREFSISVVHQLVLDVKRINALGIKKVGITGIGPLGCLPRNSASSSYQNCNAAQNNLSMSHNQMVKQNIMMFNYAAAAPVFIYLDLYNAFFSALRIDPQKPQGKLSDELKPCCVGAKGEDCGIVDKNNGEKKKYLVCDDPKKKFFWDSVHPSDAGWSAVYSVLKHSLNSLLL